MITCKSYMENGGNPETKEIFVYGYKHIKTDELVN